MAISAINPVYPGQTNPIYICDGQEHEIIFQDESDWNCTGSNISSKNISKRTIRWDYGQVFNFTVNQISGVTVIDKDNTGADVIYDMDAIVALQGDTIQYGDKQLVPDSRGNSLRTKIPKTT